MEPVVSLAFNELKYRDQYKGDFLFSLDTQKLLVWAWKVSTCLQEVTLPAYSPDRLGLKVTQSLIYILQSARKQESQLSVYLVNLQDAKPVQGIIQAAMEKTEQPMVLSSACSNQFVVFDSGCIRFCQLNTERQAIDILRRIHIASTEVMDVLWGGSRLFATTSQGHIMVLD